jgi:hypothetical protein
MAIHKPALSVKEARRLAVVRSAASDLMAKTPDGQTASAAGSSGSAEAIPLPVIRPAPKKTAPAARPAQAAGVRPKKVQVFVSAMVPAAKTSPVFDVLSRQYPPQKSLQMIMRRALDDYEEMLADGSFSGQPETYEQEANPGPTLVQTSHMMPVTLLTLARAHFDPLGLESTRAFGLKLATAALAAFFSREVRRHR